MTSTATRILRGLACLGPAAGTLGALILAGAWLGVAAGAPAPSPALESDSAWGPPPFDSLGRAARRDVERYSSRDEYEAARLDPAFQLRRWTYRSDSLRVVAFACRPREVGTGRAGGRRSSARPAVIYCRGSYVQDGMASAQLPVLHRLAEAGFVAIAPQYRGSEGGEGRDDMGGADVEDVLALVRIVTSDPAVDPKAIYLYGESRGGMMTYQALRDGAKVRAAATVGAFTDLDSLFARDPGSAAAASRIWPDYAERAQAIAERRSAIRWADRIRVPTLILFGRDDEQVSPAQGERLAAALRRHRVACELHIIENAGHVIGQRSKMRDSLVVSWFRRHAR